LGHFILHKEKETFVDYRDNQKDIMRTPREKQANAFAAALLMPRTRLIKDVKSKFKNGIYEEELSELADLYEVSTEAMKYRLMNLNLIHS
jgi:Zn-dependent peptidase ImmA (M78 family)